LTALRAVCASRALSALSAWTALGTWPIVAVSIWAPVIEPGASLLPGTAPTFSLSPATEPSASLFPGIDFTRIVLPSILFAFAAAKRLPPRAAKSAMHATSSAGARRLSPFAGPPDRLARVNTVGGQGKSGAKPARSRHCDRVKEVAGALRASHWG
jgi:hypothetical protein